MHTVSHTILFVDDEPNMLDMLKRMLALCKEKWSGEYCLDVDSALTILRQKKIDTIVADIRMPGKDGYALISSIVGDEMLSEIPIIVLTGERDRTLKRKLLDLGATDLLNKPVCREDLFARLRSALRIKEYQDRLANQVNVLDRLVRERTYQLEQSHRDAIWRLAKAGEFRDDQTGCHVARVAWCSRVLAELTDQNDEYVELLFQTSPLHDIGKIGIPDKILLKDGPLTPDERVIIEKHTIIGENILRQAPKAVSLLSRINIKEIAPFDNEHISPLIQMASTVARSHHEKWNGNGYPDHLSGETIPLAARIVALVDVYDALLSKRTYKPAMSRDQALSILQTESGKHFDPVLVGIFLDNIDKIQDIYDQFDEASGVMLTVEDIR